MMLRQIQHFQTIVQENSFTEAAELCHISQSGISQSIKALEDEIGVKLITRKNRSFELTEVGEHFYKKSLVITADLEQLCRETVRIDRKDAAEPSLGVATSSPLTYAAVPVPPFSTTAILTPPFGRLSITVGLPVIVALPSPLPTSFLSLLVSG